MNEFKKLFKKIPRQDVKNKNPAKPTDHTVDMTKYTIRLLQTCFQNKIEKLHHPDL